MSSWLYILSVSLEEDLLRKVKVVAARHDTPLNALGRNCFRDPAHAFPLFRRPQDRREGRWALGINGVCGDPEM